MSDLNEDIDNLFREIVDPAEMQPPQMVWTAIENNLEKKDHLKLKIKYRRLVIFSVAASTIIVSLLTVLFYKSYTPEKETSSGSIQKENKSEIALAYPKKENNAIPLVSSAEAKTEMAFVSEKKKEPTAAVISSEQIRTPENSALTAGENPIETAQTVTEKEESSLVSPEIATIENVKNTDVTDNNNISSEKVIEIVTAISSPEEILQSSITKSEEDLNDCLEIETPIIVDLNPCDLDPEISPTGILKVDTAQTAAKLLPIEDYKFFIGAIYSPEKISTDFVDVNSNAPAVKETQNYSYSTGVRFGYKFANKWSIFSNIVYASTSKSFAYQKVTIIRQLEEEHHLPAVYPRDEFLATSYGEITFPTYYKPNSYHGEHEEEEHRDTLTLDISAEQKVRYICIPMECQYQFGKNRFSALVSAGVSSTILVSEKAEITYKNTCEKYTANIGGLQDVFFSGIVSLGVQYRIFNRFSVFVQPSFTQAFTPINKNTPYKTYPSTIAGSAGLNFHF